MSFFAFRKPPTCLAMVLAIPFYLICWVIVQIIIRPILGDYIVNSKLAGRRGEYFGPDGPLRLLLGILQFIMIIAVICLVFYGIMCALKP